MSIVKKKKYYMIYLNATKDEFCEFFIQSIKEFTKKEGKPIGIGVSLSIASSQISIHYNLKKEINTEDKSINQFEFIKYDITKYKIVNPEVKGNNQINLWKSIRKVTRIIELPTVLYHLKDNNQFDIPIETELEIFGRAVVTHFRDHTMDYHTSYSEKYSNKSLEEAKDEFREHWNDESRKEHLKTASFFSSMNKTQVDFLNDYVLRILDNATFNVMRALDENTGNEDSQINVDINGVKAVELNMIGNGNLSGEYLDWIDRFSKYKEFQT